MNELTVYNDKALAPVDPSALAAAESAKARIQAAYIMAARKPRNADEARDRILHACRRPAFAERVEFSKPVGGKAVKGPSIRFAELALREWGNIQSDIQVIHEDDRMRRIRVSLTDLESNASFSKEIQAAKTVERRSPGDREIVGERINASGEKVYIVRATEEELDNKVSALVSKALRNEGLRLIPQDIVDEALEVARNTLLSRDKTDPSAAKKKLLDSFSEIGVKPRDIQAYLKHPTDQLTPAELQDLRGIYRAIRDGEARWADYVQPSETEELTKGKADALKRQLKAAKTTAAPQEPKPAMSGKCPNNGEHHPETFCQGCPERASCPAWSEK